VVHDLLTESGLGRFYDLNEHPGTRMRRVPARARWACLDERAVRERLLDFADARVCHVTFHAPAIHCIACVWLLENLFRLHPGIGKSRVNYPKREVAISFAPDKIQLSEVAELLASIGYEPRLTLDELEEKRPDRARKRQWLQVGVAGFAFGNIMLFSLPAYIGLDSLSGPLFRVVFGYLSLALALPVVLFSAADYWRSAVLYLRQRVLTLDVPIALGLAALYGQSAYEILSGRGEGYLDSLAGLVFFLLCGRLFQQKTHDRMAFDRDYKCFFPLTVMRLGEQGEESAALSDLRVGDRLRLRHGELIPADARLVSPEALVDYSFITGESEPVTRRAGDYLYAGGRQLGPAVEVETLKPVSQSYLTTLWSHESFQTRRDDNLDTLTNRYSRRFTRLVIAVAVGAALFWIASGATGRGLKAFASVLIVACPCALALAAPFTLGTAQRLLARLGVFLRNVHVLERLARVDTVVLDKTGTLTAACASGLRFMGTTSTAPAPVDPPARPAGGAAPFELECARSLCRHSTHPVSLSLSTLLREQAGVKRVDRFAEVPGCGLEGEIEGHAVLLGSRAWLERNGVTVADRETVGASSVLLAIDSEYRGAFLLEHEVRPEIDRLLHRLKLGHEVYLLSGDNEKDRALFREFFAGDHRLRFNQSPLDKLGFIQGLRNSGRTVMMVGDGLNDAGALKQSDVGVAVIEKAGAFSPASDVIIEADQVCRVAEILRLARRAVRIVRLSFGISALYNLAGITVAAAGVLSPLICAVLMPLSSLSVVLFACGATNWAARRTGLKP
jgi:Cu+-exporting ATPase